MQITPDLFEAYLKCPTKCFLRAHGEAPSGNAYAEWVRNQNESYRSAGVARLKEGVPREEWAGSTPDPPDLKAAKWRLAVDFPAHTQNLESRLHAVERVPSAGRGKHAQLIPIRFVLNNKLSRDDKLLLAFDALLLSATLGREVSHGKIIHGYNAAALKVKTPALSDQARKLESKIAALLSIKSPPDLILNRHCPECEFQERCRQRAVEKDDLSLLASMREKERKELNQKGVFTVTQLSYMFRPRRRPKHLRDKREKYHHSLKALAIRGQKIYVVGTPQLRIKGTPIYLDVEALPDEDLYYLIGLRVKTGDCSKQYSFWADDADGCARIWGEFLSLLATFENPCLIHYGSFEKAFLKEMCARFGGPPADALGVVQAIEYPINLVSNIFARVYFPTFSNGLKEIAGFLGFRWSEPLATGPTSVTWRQAWKVSQDQGLKDKLITYNAEDCEALALVARTITELETEDGKRQGPEVVRTEELRHPLVNKWNDFKSPLKVLETITNAAHWDYQRERVYVRSGKAPRRAQRKALDQGNARRRWRPDKLITVEATRCCPTCQGKARKHGAVRSRKRHEILFGKSSVKRRLIQYEYQRYLCPKCKIVFGAEEIAHKLGQPNKYGRSLIALLLYQIIELYIPARVVLIMLGRLFGLTLSSAMGTLFKGQLAEYYRQTHQQILDRILSGNMVNADETWVNIKGRRAYVWVLTNRNEVAYLYSATREGELVQKLLTNFKGVLVSDFYAVYDSFDCPQQKCLIHLVRDLNGSLLDNPYDEEVKDLVKSFGELLRTIVDQIDHRGLKKHFLRKYLKSVKRFYREVVHKDQGSPAAISCAERFEKNRDKLFTFLNHDGVPWNNNNAEHAMKAVAKLRDVIEGSANEKSIQEYLILLSICQTCKYQGLDFLDFLLSGERDIESFARTKRRGAKISPANVGPAVAGSISPDVRM